jgi:ABC-2 type transport system permease protein
VSAVSAPAARAVRSQARVELTLTMRRGESLLVTLAIPLGVLVFFSQVDALNTTLRDPVAFLVPGVLSLAVMATAMVSLGIATGYDRRYGVLKRLGSTPLSRGGLLAAKTVNVLLVEAVQVAAIVLLGLALGWSTSARLIPVLGLLLLGTLAFAGIGMLMAGTLPAEVNLAATNALFLVLLFLGGIAYPLAKLPAPLEDLARVLPAGALTDCVRRALNGVGLSALSATALVLWAVLAPLAAARWFRWTED